MGKFGVTLVCAGLLAGAQANDLPDSLEPSQKIECSEASLDSESLAGQVQLAVCAGDQQSALAHLRAAWPLARTSADYANLGRVYANFGLTQPALVALSQALRLEPDNPKLWQDRGAVYAQMGDLRAALWQSEIQLALDPNDSVAWNTKGNRLVRLGRPEAALTAYQKALELTPESLVPLTGLSEAYRLSGKPEKAAEISRRGLASSKDPQTEATFYNNLGLALFDLNQHREGLAALEQAEKLAPENQRFRANRLLAALKAGEFVSRQDFEWLMVRDPTNPDLFRVHGMASLSAGEYQVAREDFQTVIKIGPANADDYYKLGLTYWLLEEPQEATQYLNQALNLDPLNPEAYQVRGFIRYQAGELAGALADLEHYLDLSYQADPNTLELVEQIKNELGS